MLTVSDRNSRLGRRDFLRIGGLGLGGLTLPHLLSGNSRADDRASILPGLTTGKSVVFLFQHGGPSQIETFDPKMTAPSNIRSVTGELSTSIPGVTFGGSLPRLSKLAKSMTVVRSFTTGDSRHDIKPIVSRFSSDANLGSLYSRVVGSNHPQNGMPTNTLLIPQSINPKAEPEVTQFGKLTSTGGFGSATAPLVPGSGGDFQKDMELKLPLDRLSDRRSLLNQLDRLKAFADQKDGSIDPLRRQAFDTILGGVSEAFDLSQEDPQTIERYDTNPLIDPRHIDKKWNNFKRYVDNVKYLGKLMLLARRLCERGCGFVTVTTNFVWDMHADANNATIDEGMRYMGPPFDHAVSAFLEDVAARGLQDDILLVVCGEMGRTPKINKRGGRDHWGNLAPLMLSGGGLPMGQVIGQSSRDVAEPATTPVTIPHLISTILRTLFDPGELRVRRGVPDDILRMAAHDPIPELHG